jgi:hypothetical protein
MDTNWAICLLACSDETVMIEIILEGTADRETLVPCFGFFPPGAYALLLHSVSTLGQMPTILETI